MIQKAILISIPFYSQIETKSPKRAWVKKYKGSKNKTDIQDYSYSVSNQSYELQESLPALVV